MWQNNFRSVATLVPIPVVGWSSQYRAICTGLSPWMRLEILWAFSHESTANSADFPRGFRHETFFQLCSLLRIFTSDSFRTQKRSTLWKLFSSFLLNKKILRIDIFWYSDFVIIMILYIYMFLICHLLYFYIYILLIYL